MLLVRGSVSPTALHGSLGVTANAVAGVEGGRRITLSMLLHVYRCLGYGVNSVYSTIEMRSRASLWFHTMFDGFYS